jgi:hypothetical protein
MSATMLASLLTTTMTKLNLREELTRRYKYLVPVLKDVLYRHTRYL